MAAEGYQLPIIALRTDGNHDVVGTLNVSTTGHVTGFVGDVSFLLMLASGQIARLNAEMLRAIPYRDDDIPQTALDCWQRAAELVGPIVAEHGLIERPVTNAFGSDTISVPDQHVDLILRVADWLRETGAE